MKILHLYHDFMNLYGEYANTLALRDKLISMGRQCTIEKKTFGDDYDFSDYDILYIGSGTERNQKIVLEDLRSRADSLKSFVSSGRVVLMTGNSFEILGRSITDANGKEYEGLGFFDFTVAEQNKSRETSDALFTTELFEGELVGFINKCSEISGITETLFKVKEGLANCKGDSGEGTRMNNFFCTHLIGPALMRNDNFCSYLAKLAATR